MTRKLYYVHVVEHETERVVREIGPQPTPRDAERLQRGVNINLDHERFYTEVIDADVED